MFQYYDMCINSIQHSANISSIMNSGALRNMQNSYNISSIFVSSQLYLAIVFADHIERTFYFIEDVYAGKIWKIPEFIINTSLHAAIQFIAFNTNTKLLPSLILIERSPMIESGPVKMSLLFSKFHLIHGVTWAAISCAQEMIYMHFYVDLYDRSNYILNRPWPLNYPIGIKNFFDTRADLVIASLKEIAYSIPWGILQGIFPFVGCEPIRAMDHMLMFYSLPAAILHLDQESPRNILGVPFRAQGGKDIYSVYQTLLGDFGCIVGTYIGGIRFMHGKTLRFLDEDFSLYDFVYLAHALSEAFFGRKVFTYAEVNRLFMPRLIALGGMFNTIMYASSILSTVETMSRAEDKLLIDAKDFQKYLNCFIANYKTDPTNAFEFLKGNITNVRGVVDRFDKNKLDIVIGVLTNMFMNAYFIKHVLAERDNAGRIYLNKSMDLAERFLNGADEESLIKYFKYDVIEDDYGYNYVMRYDSEGNVLVKPTVLFKGKINSDSKIDLEVWKEVGDGIVYEVSGLERFDKNLSYYAHTLLGFFHTHVTYQIRRACICGDISSNGIIPAFFGADEFKLQNKLHMSSIIPISKTPLMQLLIYEQLLLSTGINPGMALLALSLMFCGSKSFAVSLAEEGIWTNWILNLGCRGDTSAAFAHNYHSFLFSQMPIMGVAAKVGPFNLSKNLTRTFGCKNDNGVDDILVISSSKDVVTFINSSIKLHNIRFLMLAEIIYHGFLLISTPISTNFGENDPLLGVLGTVSPCFNESFMSGTVKPSMESSLLGSKVGFYAMSPSIEDEIGLFVYKYATNSMFITFFDFNIVFHLRANRYFVINPSMALFCFFCPSLMQSQKRRPFDAVHTSLGLKAERLRDFEHTLFRYIFFGSIFVDLEQFREKVISNTGAGAGTLTIARIVIENDGKTLGGMPENYFYIKKNRWGVGLSIDLFRTYASCFITQNLLSILSAVKTIGSIFVDGFGGTKANISNIKFRWDMYDDLFNMSSCLRFLDELDSTDLAFRILVIEAPIVLINFQDDRTTFYGFPLDLVSMLFGSGVHFYKCNSRSGKSSYMGIHDDRILYKSNFSSIVSEYFVFFEIIYCFLKGVCSNIFSPARLMIKDMVSPEKIKERKKNREKSKARKAANKKHLAVVSGSNEKGLVVVLDDIAKYEATNKILVEEIGKQIKSKKDL